MRFQDRELILPFLMSFFKYNMKLHIMMRIWALIKHTSQLYIKENTTYIMELSDYRSIVKCYCTSFRYHGGFKPFIWSERSPAYHGTNQSLPHKTVASSCLLFQDSQKPLDPYIFCCIRFFAYCTCSEVGNASRYDIDSSVPNKSLDCCGSY